MTPAARFWRRVYAIARKEALHVRRDARSLVLGFVMPIALLILKKERWCTKRNVKAVTNRMVKDS